MNDLIKLLGLEIDKNKFDKTRKGNLKMNIYDEILKEIKNSGTLQEKIFCEKHLFNTKENTSERLTQVVQSLYNEGYTPAEVKGFLRVAERITDYTNPIRK